MDNYEIDDESETNSIVTILCQDDELVKFDRRKIKSKIIENIIDDLEHSNEEIPVSLITKNEIELLFMLRSKMELIGKLPLEDCKEIIGIINKLDVDGFDELYVRYADLLSLRLTHDLMD